MNKRLIFESIIGESVAGFDNDMPRLSSGSALNSAQQLAIQPLLDNGVPEVIDFAAVKSEASRRILALLPAHKQANTLARSLELLEILASGGTLTAEEEADRLAAKAAWSVVSAIRAASNTIESQELPTDYLGLIDAFDAILA